MASAHLVGSFAAKEILNKNLISFLRVVAQAPNGNAATCIKYHYCADLC